MTVTRADIDRFEASMLWGFEVSILQACGDAPVRLHELEEELLAEFVGETRASFLAAVLGLVRAELADLGDGFTLGTTRRGHELLELARAC
jgi:hypothetical protein